MSNEVNSESLNTSQDVIAQPAEDQDTPEKASSKKRKLET